MEMTPEVKYNSKQESPVASQLKRKSALTKTLQFKLLMRAVIQRVTEAFCTVDHQITGQIEQGFLVLLGIEEADTSEDLEWLAAKIANMRIFSDENGLMNKSLTDIDGSILLISQFTLFAQTKKGNRPGFTRAAKPDKAIPLYEKMIEELEKLTGKKPQTGIFGADMKINLLNDGPVTIIMDTKDKENH
jgi:D-tyrosyl-tRNA(Tyr) deacylase